LGTRKRKKDENGKMDEKRKREGGITN